MRGEARWIVVEDSDRTAVPPLWRGPVSAGRQNVIVAIRVEIEHCDRCRIRSDRKGARYFPITPSSFDPTYGGDYSDGFVTRIDMLPYGVATYGQSSPGCIGPLAMPATSIPIVGNTAFSVTCGNAPANAVGGLLVGGAGLAVPMNVLGVDVLVDPSGPFFAVPSVSSNQAGAAELVLPIHQDPALRGVHLFTQFLWLGPAAPAPCPQFGLSASDALHITVL